MFDPVNEPTFRLDVAGLSDAFEVLAFTGNEALSEPFAFEIDVLIDDVQLDLAGLLHRSVFLHFDALRNGVHGQLHSLVQHEHGPGVRLCRARLGPKLNCLALRFSQRVFSGCSVPQILAQVLKEHGISGGQRRFELGGDYPPLAFCTQYRESDLQLLQRLCAQAGIHYHFEHRRDGHCLVFGDDVAQLPRAGAAQFADVIEDEAPAVRRWQLHNAWSPSEGGTQAAQRAEGETDLACLRSGRWLPLAGHPFAERNLVLLFELSAYAVREPSVRPLLLQWMEVSESYMSQHFGPAAAKILDAFIDGVVMRNIIRKNFISQEEVAEFIHKITA